jgi:hypothetical protein
MADDGPPPMPFQHINPGIFCLEPLAKCGATRQSCWPFAPWTEWQSNCPGQTKPRSNQNRIAPVAFHFFGPIWIVLNHVGVSSMFHPKNLIRIAGAVCLAILLSACVIEPAWGPYRHHHHDGY